MNILVCLKQILDPDIPARDFRIDPEAMQLQGFCRGRMQTGRRSTLSCFGGLRMYRHCLITDRRITSSECGGIEPRSVTATTVERSRRQL